MIGIILCATVSQKTKEGKSTFGKHFSGLVDLAQDSL